MTLRSLFTAGALVMIGMLVGRMLGLLREMVLSGTFGIGHEADMAIMLLIIPDFIAMALVGGGASATLIPTFAAREPREAMALLWQALLASVGFLALSALGIFLYVEQHDSAGVVAGHKALALLFLGSLPLTAATAILTGWLQYRGRFIAPAFATAIFNTVIILVLWRLPVGLPVLAAAIFCAALARLLAHVIAFYRCEKRLLSQGIWRAPWQLDGPLLKNYLATTTSGVLSMIPPFAPYAILALAGGGVAVFNYAFKLILMPAMLGQGVIQMVLLPWLVHHKRAQQESPSTSPYSIALLGAWVLSLAMCLSLSMASGDIARLFFSYGRMTEADVAVVGRLFAIGVWALPGMLLTSVWQQILYAHANSRDPLLSNTLLAALVVPVCWLGNAWMGFLGMTLWYAAIQGLPVVWLARAGRRLGIISSFRPSEQYVRVTAALLMIWLPLMGLYNYSKLPPLEGVILAAVIGGLTFFTGLLALAPARLVIWQRVKNCF